MSFKPNAVIGVGGYSSFPVLRVASQEKSQLLFMKAIPLRAEAILCWLKER